MRKGKRKTVRLLEFIYPYCPSVMSWSEQLLHIDTPECTSFDSSFSRFIQTAVVHPWQGVAMSIEWRHVITDITVHLQRGGAIGTFSIGWRHVIAGRSFNGPAIWNFNANVFSHFSSAWRGEGGVCPFPPVWEDNVIPHFLSLPRFSLLRNY